MYVRIRPTDDRLAPATVTDYVRRLHGLDGQPDSWWRRLLADDPEPIEFFQVADGDDERRFEYYACVADEECGDQLERILRGLFPESYELTTVDRPRFPTSRSPDWLPPTGSTSSGVI